MILVAAGDSFIWGSELSDSPHGGPDGYSLRTFPALLAKENNFTYICSAYPGNANNGISRMAIDSCSNLQNVFLMVTWTYPQRAEFYLKEKWISLNSWHTKEELFSKEYFKHVGDNEYYEIYSVLKEIVFLQNFCQIKKIPYMFLTADNHFFQHENYTRSKDSSIENLFNLINWQNWFWFPKGQLKNETSIPRGFYQWAIENKYDIGAQGHPLEQAHQDAANLMEEKFNELVKKNF